MGLVEIISERPRFTPEKHYLGTLCVRRHDAGDGRSWRHLGHGNCVTCTRERARSWAAENPERAKANTSKRDNRRDNTFRRGRWPFALHVGGCRARALKAGLKTDLTPDGVKRLWNDQAGLCFWTGKPLDFHAHGPKHPLRPSLDRLAVGGDYTLENVVWSSCFANFGRGTLGVDETVELMKGFGFIGPYLDPTYGNKLRRAAASFT